MKKILTLLLVLVLCVSVFAACKKEEPQPEQPTYDVAAAAEYVEGLYKEELGTTAADFNVVPQVRVAGATYTVTWTVDTDKVTVEVSEDGKTVTINVPEKSDEDFSYSLTATVKAPDGTTASTSFTCNVIKYAVNSHADYMAAQKDDELTIEGIVVAINSVSMGNKYNHLFLADAEVDGGYYCYKLSADPAELGIKVGMTVSITSKASPYNGMQELFGGTPVIVDETIKTVDVLDITDAFTAKSDLGAYVGLPVTIKGVTLGEQALEKDTDQYLWFAIGDAKGYVRTYVTDFPAGMLAAGDKAAIDADHKDHFGWKADVTGILVLYSGQPYLIPMSVTPFTNYEEQIKTPEEKVAAELAGVKLDASLSSDKVIDLLLAGQYYDDVVLTWTTTDETGAAVIADGKLTLTVPDEAITVSITVTATCGDVSDSKTLTVKLSKSITSIADALVVAGGQEHNTYTTEKYILGGIIVEIQNATYGNMIIKDENGDSILIYGVYINGAKYGEAEGDKPVVGDYIVVIGGLGRYNDTKQMKNGDLMSFVAASSIKDAADAGAAQEHDTYTENKFLVTGVIESIANAKYGNMTIKDADGNSIYVYGVYNQVGVRYDSLTTLPAIGDTVTLLGVAGQYNGTVQLKNATIVAHTVASTEPPVEEECEHNYVDGVCSKCGETDPNYVPGGSTTPDPDTHVCVDEDMNFVCDDTTCGKQVLPAANSVLTVEQALALGALYKHTDYTGLYTTDKYYVTGVITDIYNTTYGNLYIKDANGNEFTVYGTYDATGATRYDNLTVKPVKGDTITVYGVIGAYGNSVQMNNGWITEHTAHEHNYSAASCTAPATCSICGATTGEALGHGEADADGKCPICGEDLAAPMLEETFAIAASKGSLADKVITWNSDNFVFTGAQAKSTTAIRTSDTDHYRVYQSSTFAIAGNNGQKIFKVVFTVTESKYASILQASLATAGATVTVSGTTVTVEFVGGVDSVDFSATAQFRIKTMVISYKA